MSSRGNEDDLAAMPITSPTTPGGLMDPSSDALGPQTPAQMSEIDLSSPLLYGTPGSARTPGSIRTPRGATTPVRQRADLGMSSRVRTVNLNSDQPGSGMFSCYGDSI